MKTSAILVSAFAAVAIATPEFTNTDFNVEQGQPFELTYTGCDNGCTIYLENGPTTDLQNVQTLTSDATGESTTVTLKGLPSDTYAFKIVDNSDTSDYNYSKQFKYTGTGSATMSVSTAASTSASTAMTSSSASSATSQTSMTSMTSVTSMTSAVTTSSASTSNKTSTMATTTKSEASHTTSSSPHHTTTVPGAAGRVSSPMALVAGGVVAMVLFN